MTEAADDARSELSAGLYIASRLRQCLRFDFPTPEESELEQAAREAVNELELLIAHCERLEAWQRKGECLIGQQGVSAAFYLGSWWADRPWRSRDA